MFFWTLYLQRNSEQIILVLTKLLCSTIDNNNKSVLSSKSAYYNGFWRIMWHWSLEKLYWKYAIKNT